MKKTYTIYAVHPYALSPQLMNHRLEPVKDGFTTFKDAEQYISDNEENQTRTLAIIRTYHPKDNQK